MSTQPPSGFRARRAILPAAAAGVAAVLVVAYGPFGGDDDGLVNATLLQQLAPCTAGHDDAAEGHDDHVVMASTAVVNADDPRYLLAAGGALDPSTAAGGALDPSTLTVESTDVLSTDVAARNFTLSEPERAAYEWAGANGAKVVVGQPEEWNASGDTALVPGFMLIVPEEEDGEPFFAGTCASEHFTEPLRDEYEDDYAMVMRQVPNGVVFAPQS